MQRGSNLWGIWTLCLAAEEKAELFADASGWGAGDPAFSPDGRWIAYVSAGDLRTFQIFVQPFPKIGTSRYQITREGANMAPMWSPDGKTLFYYNSDSKKLFAVSTRTEPTLSWDSPVALPIEGMIQSESAAYDVMPDGKRLLVILPETQSSERPRRTQQINIVVNWLEELKQRVPTAKK